MSTKSSSRAKGHNKVIISIDFGTTFSGVAWAQTKRSKVLNAIDKWPSSKSTHDDIKSDKVPTLLRYSGFGNEELEWGFQIPEDTPSREIHQWFKLDLDPSNEESDEEAALGERPGKFKDPLTPVSDYLKGLAEQIVHCSDKSIGKTFHKKRFEFVLTVPAVWTELATQRTIDAFRQTGAEIFANAPVHVVSEPEAAALYTFSGLAPDTLNVGESFVVCDAGGGTVDLISYTITKVHPFLELKEATAGGGGRCGSLFLNKRFEELLRQKIGNVPGSIEKLVKQAVDEFEIRIKRTFTTTSKENASIEARASAIPESEHKRLGKIVFTVAELRDIFEPIISKIIKLVEDQIKASGVAIRAVFLVGGFGDSTYLRESLESALPETEIIQPRNSWLAVAYGAVMKGLELSDPKSLTRIKVRDRVARKHMGTDLNWPYCPDRHTAYSNAKYWSGYHGTWRINAMRWFIEKGDTVSEEKPFTQDIYDYRLVSDGHPLSRELTIFSDDVGRPAPFRRDAMVQELCRVKMDLSQIPEHSFTRKTGADGFDYYEIRYKLEWVYHSRTTTFTIIHEAIRYDSVTIKYV